MRSAQVSPSYPAPKRNLFESANKRRLSNAIEGLEDLVQEAVHITEDNPNQNHIEEVYEIIEDATKAIKNASPPTPPHRKAPELPLVSQGIREPSMLPTPPELYPKRSRGPSAIDWAYKPEPAGASSSSNSSIERRRLRFSDHNGLDSPVPLQPTQSGVRDHVDYVIRPSIVRGDSRGRSRLRKIGQIDGKSHLHRHHLSFRSPDGNPRGLHHRQRSSSYSHSDPALDDEEDLEKGHDDLTIHNQMRHHTFNLRRQHRRQPIGRNWTTGKKRIAAVIACINTSLLGIIVGIYAGEVPRIQYMLADERHIVIVGNVVLYAGLAISTFISWPLPLLHGRKPYILAALALALPLQFPQAVVVGTRRSPKDARFRTGLLVARLFTGLVLGFANVNFITVLLDLFGASLQSKNPHQEVVVANDVRRHGGGMGLWLGIWSWCWIASLAIGFQIGAGIIESLTPDWGFYITVILLAAALVLNVLGPETRRAPYRRSVTEVYDRDENFITRRVARGEIKLHISTEGPKYWFEEVWAGIKLSTMMMCQVGFAVLAFYLGWIYAQIVLVIVLLGALLSRDYRWHPQYVGLGVLSIAIGALLAVPLTKAGIFSRDRMKPYRTDSMTFEKQVTWSSHLVRRVIFTITLPLMGLAYTVSSAGRPKPYMVPIVFAGAVGFLSILAIAECTGLIMETFDTCDLQPGSNTRHRLQSMAVQDRRRRTNYSSFPRVSAGIFVTQTIAFVGAAVATEVGGIMTRHIGAQASTGVTAGILLALTLLLAAVLWRFRQVQVVPNHTFGTRRDTQAWEEFKQLGERKASFQAVVIGNPSGKTRKMSVLELGGLSRWTEIRKLNFLIRDEGRRWGWH
ncbi:hypothetical protein EJ04DRAFT_462922 [Polyplosphaeria fusca]|uniref:MFS general substrate transporter n=1 Tax=Polyplosphaeria fusca TaxID=682080 RepID=A0A9P4V1N3_9PLEO|nr:hypothetical protein EJ04DRAFT_462922 [Polyplosphaeria fusca]